MNEAEEDDDGMRDFGQKVDLCQRIRDVTVNYPEGALLKEMVQNADDAGASTFKVLLDCRTHPHEQSHRAGTSKVPRPGAADLQ